MSKELNKRCIKKEKRDLRVILGRGIIATPPVPLHTNDQIGGERAVLSARNLGPHPNKVGGSILPLPFYLHIRGAFDVNEGERQPLCAFKKQTRHMQYSVSACK